MKLYVLEPEVAGELGKNTIFENFNEVRLKLARPNVKHLHYVFSGWLGDEILECTPCFIVTESLAEDIENSGLSGYCFDKVEVSISEDFEELYPNRSLPRFMRLIPCGTVYIDGERYNDWSGHDICISQKSYLTVTEECLRILQSHNLNYCNVIPLEITNNQ